MKPSHPAQLVLQSLLGVLAGFPLPEEQRHPVPRVPRLSLHNQSHRMGRLDVTDTEQHLNETNQMEMKSYCKTPVELTQCTLMTTRNYHYKWKLYVKAD